MATVDLQGSFAVTLDNKNYILHRDKDDNIVLTEVQSSLGKTKFHNGMAGLRSIML